jgi:acetyl esterase/lipase
VLYDPRAVLTRPAPPPDRTLRYGDHPDHVIDLRLPPPDGAPRPLVVFIHGGFWRAAWDRSHAGPLSADLAARGWPVATIDFRRVGQPGGGWPGTFTDVGTALRTVPAIIADLGLTAPRPILAGHSAGGQLAMWAAAEGAEALGILALAPVCDLRLAHTLRLGDNAVHDLLGGGPDEVPERYRATDPMVRPPAAPVMIIHGTEDDRVPVELSRGYAAATGARLTELPETEHFGVIDPESAAWPKVLTTLDSFDRR